MRLPASLVPSTGEETKDPQSDEVKTHDHELPHQVGVCQGELQSPMVIAIWATLNVSCSRIVDDAERTPRRPEERTTGDETESDDSIPDLIEIEHDPYWHHDTVSCEQAP